MCFDWFGPFRLREQRKEAVASSLQVAASPTRNSTAYSTDCEYSRATVCMVAFWVCNPILYRMYRMGVRKTCISWAATFATTATTQAQQGSDGMHPSGFCWGLPWCNPKERSTCYYLLEKNRQECIIIRPQNLTEIYHGVTQIAGRLILII